MKPKYLLPLLLGSLLLSSCGESNITLEKAKEIHTSIGNTVLEATYIPNVSKFTRIEYKASGLTRTDGKTIYNHDELFYSKYEITNTSSISESFYFTGTDQEGFYLTSARKINGKWDEKSIETSHFMTKELLVSNWDNKVHSFVMNDLRNDILGAYNRVSTLIENIEKEDVKAEATFTSSGENSLSTNGYYEYKATENKKEVTKEASVKAIFKENMIHSYELSINKGDEYSIGYNFSKAIIHIPDITKD